MPRNSAEMESKDDFGFGETTVRLPWPFGSFASQNFGSLGSSVATLATDGFLGRVGL